METTQSGLVLRSELQIIPGDFLTRVPREEVSDVVIDNEITRVEVICSPPGFSSPEGFWYDQDKDELVSMRRGQADIRFENGRIIPMIMGDVLYIPAHIKHRIEKVYERTDWLAVFYKR